MSYVARSHGMRVGIGRTGVSLAGANGSVSMRVENANPSARMQGEARQEGVSHYYLGTRQFLNIPHYERVRAAEIRPGVDILYYPSGDRLEYDVVVKPGTDPSALRLRFDVRPEITPEGDLRLGPVFSHKPIAWQQTATGRREIASRYRIDPATGAVGFEVAAYDHTRPLTIDPVLTYSTFLGSSDSNSTDAIRGLAVDSTGAAYVTGGTDGANFPSTTKIGSKTYGTWAFVTKLNSSGTAVIYSVVFGGHGSESANAIALDSSGNAWVTGYTNSTDFPATDGTKTTWQDGFVAKISPAGTLAFASCLGGGNYTSGMAISINRNSGTVYAAGSAYGVFPTASGAYQSSLRGGNDAFIAAYSSSGARVAATLIGGSSGEFGQAIAVDNATGNVILAGVSGSSNYPVIGSAVQSSYAGGGQDAVLSVFNAGLTAVWYSTFLGGTGSDSANGVAVDSNSNYYVAGSSTSNDFPTTSGAFKTVKNYGTDGFVTKISPAGALAYSTYLGDGSDDTVQAISVTSSGSAVVAGETSSFGFPTTPGSLLVRQQYTSGVDAFLSVLNPAGDSLTYSTLLGSSANDQAKAIALDGSGSVFVAGSTTSPNFPTTPGAVQATFPKNSAYNYYTSGFITKIDLSSPVSCTATINPTSIDLPGRGGTASFTLAVPAGCPWELTAAQGVTLKSPVRGIGASNIAVDLSVGQNDTTYNTRTLTVTAGAASFTINQAAGSCDDPVFTPDALTFDSDGGVRNLNIVLPGGCQWAVAPADPWLSVTLNPTGSGPGSTTVFATPNGFGGRSTTIRIASKSVSVTQTGQSCTSSLSIPITAFSAQGGGGSARLTTSAGSCNWSAFSLVPWIQITTATAAGQGSGSIAFLVAQNPAAIARSGRILIGDRVATITQSAGPYGTVSGYTSSIFAGRQGYSGSTGDGGPATSATLDTPRFLVYDSSSSKLYISQYGRIRVVGPDGIIDTFAGGGQSTADNVPVLDAKIIPSILALDGSGNLYFADSYYRVRKINGGIISAVAGNGQSGDAGGNVPALTAPLGNIVSLAADTAGAVYIGDAYNKIRKIESGMLTTVAGGADTFADNVPPTATSLRPYGLVIDRDGSLLVADLANLRVRRITLGSAPSISTIAGGGSSSQDGVPATSAWISSLSNIALDNIGNLLLADGYKLRRVDSSGTITTLFSSSYVIVSVAADPDGSIYYADTYYTVRKLAPNPTFCSFTIPTPAQQPSAAGSLTLSLTAGSGCTWTAFSDLSWATVDTTSGTGSANLSVTLAANPNATPRTGTVFIGGQPVTITQNGVPIVPPELGITMTHAGNFFAGQTGATFTIVVSNRAGAGPTTANVDVANLVLAGLTLNSMSGAGWTCSGNGCSRSDVLAGGASYPAITVSVDVAMNASSPQTNSAYVTGGGSQMAVTTDTVVIGTPPAALSISQTHKPYFISGQTGASITITVRNGFLAGATVGPVTVTETLTPGLTLVSMSGTGWSCSGASCTRSDSLGPVTMVPSITALINVASNAASPQSSTAAVSGGGSAPASVSDSIPIFAHAPSSTRDIRGSGTSDVVLYNPQNGFEYSGLSNGAGGFEYVATPYTPGFTHLRLGDFNGDGKADLVVYNNLTALAYIGMGDGTGRFNFQSLFWSPGFQYVVPCDLDGDGRTDFVLYRPTDGTMYTALSNGDGTFRYKYNLVSLQYSQVVPADFDGDGKSDLMLYRRSDGLAFAGISDGAGGFMFTRYTGADSGADFVEAGDVNGDGHADVLFYSATTGWSRMAIRVGGTFNSVGQYWSPGFTTVKLADFDSDGRADLALYNKNNTLGYLGIPNGVGGFNFGSLFWGPGVDNVDVMDLNGDGRPDVVLYNSLNGAAYTGINNGNMTAPFNYQYSYWGNGRMLAH